MYIFQGFAQMRGIKWMFSGYLLFLLAGGVTYIFLPDIEPTEDAELGVVVSPQEFYTALENKEIANLEGVIIAKEWEFDLTSNQLDISRVAENQFVDGPIYVERSKNLTNEISVKLIRTTTLASHQDLTSKIPLPNVELVGETLRINGKNGPSEFEFTSFEKEFILAQFDDDDYKDRFIGIGNMTLGEEALYVEVPSDVELPNSMNDIFIID